MKKILLICLTIAGLNCFAQETIINDKNAEVRNVGQFNAIKVSGAIDVFISQGNEDAVAVSASEEKYRDKIKTEVNGHTLKIYFDGDKLSWSIGNKKLRAYVSFKQIQSLEATGASSFKINGTVSGGNLNVKLVGASSLAGNLKFSKVTADLNGASQIRISGRVEDIDIDASGASDVKGYDLATDACSVKATGASDVRITVNKEISVNATGASSIYYKGDAVMTNVHTTGASNVSKK
jgi:hypothetical protein